MEDIYSDYDYSIKKNLKKAASNSLSIREANSSTDIEAYCDLSDFVARKHGRPSYSREFFHNVYRFMAPSTNARFLLAWCHERPLRDVCTW